MALAEARGFTYRPASDIAADDYAALIACVEALAPAGGAVAFDAEADAALGLVASLRPRLSEVLTDFFALTSDRLKGKNEGQIRRWKNVRSRSAANMIKVFGDKSINEITLEDAIAFRSWWQGRVAKGHVANTANKELGHASNIFETVNTLRSYGLVNQFGGLSLRDLGGSKRDPCSTDFIRGRILAPGALDRLNPEARDVLLAMINTGAGPNEIIGLEPEDFLLDHEIL